MTQHFAEHGAIRAEVRGRILVVESFGIWNPEMYRKNLGRNDPALDAFKATAPWAMLLIRRDLMVVHADILALMYENLPLMRQKNINLVATAWVASPELEGYPIVMPLLLKYHRHFAPCEVFLREADAEEWLLRQLENARAAKGE